MTRGVFLGLDVGTQSTKALLYDAEAGEVVGRGQVEYDLIEGLPPGAAEQQPSTWIDAIEGAVAAARSDAPAHEVRGIGVSGQQHGAVLVDASHAPLRAAKLWCDTETAPEAARLSEALGRNVPAGFTAPKLRFTADREPEIWERVAHVMLPHDYVNAWLTGEVFTERGDASGTGYLDPVTGEYDDAALGEVAPDLARRVPRLIAPNAIGGELRTEIASKLGLAAGVPVSAGGGDNMMSAIGSGATRPGVVTCSLGTSGTIFAFDDAPRVDPDGLIAAFRASSAAASGDAGHLPLLCVMNCTEPLESIVALTGKSHAELTELASAREPRADDAVFVPFLVGERVPNLPNARGSMSGLGLESLDAGALYRTTMEGVSFGLAAGLDRMRALGVAPEEIRLVGGAAANPLWQSLLATLFDVPIRALREQETAALGGALQAFAATGGDVAVDVAGTALVEPRGDWAEPYAALRARYADDLLRS